MYDEIKSITFNQDSTCFACGTKTGFSVYGTEPLQEKFKRSIEGGISVVQLLFRANIIALIGAEENSTQYKVMIWDDNQGKCVGDLVFRSEVKAVRLRKDKIVVAIEHKVFVYNFANLQLQSQFETQANPKGLIEMSTTQNDMTVLACPGLHIGQVRVENFDRKYVQYISAHDGSLQDIKMTMNGKILATCSERGTLIRIWRTEDNQKLQELRRGTEHAHIYSIALSPQCDYLAVASDKGTLHIFNLSEQVKKSFDRQGPMPTPDQSTNVSQALPLSDSAVAEESQSSLGEAGASSPQVAQQQSPKQNSKFNIFHQVQSIQNNFSWPVKSSETSFAKIRLPPNVKAVVGFPPSPNTVLALCQNGYMYQVKFDPEMKGKVYKQVREKFFQFQNLEDSVSGLKEDGQFDTVQLNEEQMQDIPDK